LVGQKPSKPEKPCRVEVHLGNLLNVLHGSVAMTPSLAPPPSLHQLFIRHRVHPYAASPSYLPKLMEVEAAAPLI
jgi:hypothetical protein